MDLGFHVTLLRVEFQNEVIVHSFTLLGYRCAGQALLDPHFMILCALQEAEEGRIQAAQQLISLCTAIMQVLLR